MTSDFSVPLLLILLENYLSNFPEKNCKGNVFPFFFSSNFLFLLGPCSIFVTGLTLLGGSGKAKETVSYDTGHIWTSYDTGHIWSLLLALTAAYFKVLYYRLPP